MNALIQIQPPLSDNVRVPRNCVVAQSLEGLCVLTQQSFGAHNIHSSSRNKALDHCLRAWSEQTDPEHFLASRLQIVPSLRTSAISATERMKALRNHKDGLKIDDIPIPSPGAGEVLVKVHSAAITAHELNWSETTDRKSPPIPAHDVAGNISKVGEGVDGFKEGDEVFALVSFSRDGAAAEYAIASAGALANKPRSLSFEEAAAIPLSALTAWQAIHQQVDAKPEQKVLITGAGGMVFMSCLQIDG